MIPLAQPTPRRTRLCAIQASRLGVVVDQITQMLATLQGLTDVRGVQDVVKRQFVAGDADFLAELGMALDEKRGAAADQVWQYRNVFDHLLRLLTITPGQKNVEQALRL